MRLYIQTSNEELKESDMLCEKTNIIPIKV